MELNPTHLLVLGIVASVLVQVIKLVLAYWKGIVLTKRKISFFLVGIAIVMAVAFLYPELGVSFEDPMEGISMLVSRAGTITGLAYLFYVWLLKYLVDAFGLDEERMIEAKG